MSRLIVKNLPKKVEEENIRQLFSQKGIVTDVQLKYTKDGKFRQFGFIGYEKDEEAQAAIKYFNQTFVKTSKIIVELCSDISNEKKADTKIDKEKPQENNKLTAIKATKATKAAKVKELIDEHKNDPLFKEFMEAHSKSSAVWENDVKLGSGENEAEKLPTKEPAAVSEVSEKLADAKISDKDYLKSIKKVGTAKTAKKPMVELFTVKLRNLPKNTKRQDVLKFFSPLKPHSVRIPGLKMRFAYAGFKTKVELNKALAKHKSFLNGKQIEVFDFTAKNQLPSEDNQKTENIKWKNQLQQIEGEDDICESGKLFFRNLAYSVTEDDLQKVFEKYGPVAEIHVPIDTNTRKVKGFGTVTFMMPEHAVKAFTELNGTQFHGRMFHLMPGKADDKVETNIDENNFKEKKKQKLKQQAGSSHNWNTLFMGPNAVADAMASNFNVTKEHLLDTAGGGTNAAVRLALGETQIILDMKKFLEENGVKLKAFEGIPQKRSKTILLAKNLPAGTASMEMRGIFEKFGILGRVLLPQSGVTCIIEFAEPSEAKKAFKSMAYKMFHGQPLFLEWAPEDTFSIEKPATIETTETNNAEPKPQTEVSSERVEEEVDDTPPEENTTLFIKNLNFSTREPAVRKHFEKIGDIHSVQVAMKNENGERISLGYGFIQFKKKSTLEKALKNLQFSQIEGNKIELKRSDRTLSTAVQASKKSVKTGQKQTGTKILVRNIPFQAKDSELQDLFKVFGEIKALRLPRKFNAETHRGFGFVDFFTKEDAKRAFETLSGSVHLYGRRLVLEWAEEDGVEDIRKRTASHFSGNKPQSKRTKAVFSIEDANVENDEDDE